MEINNNSQNVFSLQRVVSRIFSKWYWILLSVLVSAGIAYLINRYTAPDYEVTASLYIKQSKDKTNSIEQFLLSRQNEQSSKLYDESFFLRSRGLVQATLRQLNFGVSYFQDTETVRQELYKDSPIEVVFDTTATAIPYGSEIKCLIKSPNYYSLTTDDEETQKLFKQTQYEFGKAYNENGFQFTVLLKKPSNQSGKEVVFLINTLDALTGEYLGKLNVESEAEDASILILKSTGKNPQKEVDFLNQHINQFVNQDLQEKNVATAKTSQFIDQILTKNTDTLNKYTRDLQRSQGSIASLAPDAKGNVIQGELSALEKERAEVGYTRDYLTYLNEQLRKNSDISQVVIPSTGGVENPVLNANLQQLTQLQQELTLMGADPNSRNPLIQSTLQRMAELKRAVLQNVTGLIANADIKLRSLDARIANYRGLTRSVIPEANRQFADIQRNLSVTEELVNFLMQKKAEAGIARASTASDYKPVDYAVVSGTVQSPIKNYITAIIIGLMLPIAFIVLKDSFNNKVVTKSDLLNNTSLPLLGIIGYDGPSKKAAISYNYKASLTAESFRSVRTNLSYFIDSEEGAKVLTFISSIPREGKTFCSKYLAFILSISGKKTLLINADMRKPDGNADLEVEGFTGLSHYLSGKATINEVIMRTKVDNLYYVRSGEVPPNPAELLLNARMKQLIDTVRESFDYIIIDTPPVSAFSDSAVLIKYTDLAICVVRQNHTTKALLNHFNDLYANNQNVKMAVLFNHVNMQKLDSGYKASYYNGAYYQNNDKSTWWKQLLPG